MDILIVKGIRLFTRDGFYRSSLNRQRFPPFNLVTQGKGVTHLAPLRSRRLLWSRNPLSVLLQTGHSYGANELIRIFSS